MEKFSKLRPPAAVRIKAKVSRFSFFSFFLIFKIRKYLRCFRIKMAAIKLRMEAIS